MKISFFLNFFECWEIILEKFLKVPSRWTFRSVEVKIAQCITFRQSVLSTRESPDQKVNIIIVRSIDTVCRLKFKMCALRVYVFMILHYIIYRLINIRLCIDSAVGRFKKLDEPESTCVSPTPPVQNDYILFYEFAWLFSMGLNECVFRVDCLNDRVVLATLTLNLKINKVI